MFNSSSIVALAGNVRLLYAGGEIELQIFQLSTNDHRRTKAQ